VQATRHPRRSVRLRITRAGAVSADHITLLHSEGPAATPDLTVPRPLTVRVVHCDGNAPTSAPPATGSRGACRVWERLERRGR
jgi:hypothetical protein